MGLPELLKKVGKGLLVTAASAVAGVTLGPIAAGAVGSFLSKSMSQIGVTVGEDVIAGVIKDKISSGTEALFNLAKPDKADQTAREIAAQVGLDLEQVQAALQYAMRELQTDLSGIMMELKGDSALLEQVLQLAMESGVKIDAVLQQQAQTRDAVEEVLRRLDAMEAGLDTSFRKFIGPYSQPDRLDFARLMTISKLQRQRTIMASSFGVKYDPDLYVPRAREESTFDKFMGDVGMSDRNIFLVLGNAGLGKTWFMARMSDHALESGSPTFFVPLAHGLKSLTSIFQVETLPALVDLIDPVLSKAGEHAVIFLDGLDEMDPTNIKYLLGGLSSARSNTVSFVLSCRAADWASNKAIVSGSYDIRYFIYEEPNAKDAAKALRISTPVSVLMTEFTDNELSAAMKKYGIPREVPEDLLPLLKRPYILKLSAMWYQQVGSLPSPSSPEFLDLFAGGPEYVDTVFRRLGILTERDSLYATVEKIIEAKRESLLLGELPMDSESSTFNTLVSSGMIVIKLDKSGTIVSVSPEFLVPLCSLAILRHQSDPPRIKTLLGTVKQTWPEKGAVIYRIVSDIVFPRSALTEPAAGQGVERPAEPKAPDARVELPKTGPAAVPPATQKRGLRQESGPAAPPAESPEPRATPAKKGLAQAGSTAPPAAASSPSTTTPPIKRLGQDSSASVRAAATAPSATAAAPAAGPAPAKKGLVQYGAQAPSRMVGASDYTGVVEILKPLLIDKDVHVRRAAVIGLGMVAARLKDQSQKIALVKPLLEDSDTDVRAGAIWAMTLIASTLKDDTQKVDLLKPYITDDEWVVRRRAAFGLGLTAAKFADASKRTAVLKPLYEHIDGQVRTGAVNGSGFGSLRMSNPAEMVPILTPFLDDSFDDVRGAAALSLSLLSSTQADQSAIIQKLGANLSSGYGKIKVRTALGLSLVGGRCGNAAQIIADVAPLLKDKSFEARSMAAIGIGLASAGIDNPSKVAGQLEPLLGDEENDVRSMAALGLSLIASRLPATDMVSLLTKLIKHNDEVVRSSGAVGMGIASTRFAKPIDRIALLKPLMNDAEKSVRKGALLGMSLAATKLPNLSERVELIAPYIMDSDPTIRRAAALALGVAASEVELLLGTVAGEVFWGITPLEHDECLVAGWASCLTLVHGV